MSTTTTKGTYREKVDRIHARLDEIREEMGLLENKTFSENQTLEELSSVLPSEMVKEVAQQNLSTMRPPDADARLSALRAEQRKLGDEERRLIPFLEVEKRALASGLSGEARVKRLREIEAEIQTKQEEKAKLDLEGEALIEKALETAAKLYGLTKAREIVYPNELRILLASGIPKKVSAINREISDLQSQAHELLVERCNYQGRIYPVEYGADPAEVAAYAEKLGLTGHVVGV